MGIGICTYDWENTAASPLADRRADGAEVGGIRGSCYVGTGG